jgi:hypothetical protein
MMLEVGIPRDWVRGKSKDAHVQHRAFVGPAILSRIDWKLRREILSIPMRNVRVE